MHSIRLLAIWSRSRAHAASESSPGRGPNPSLLGLFASVAIGVPLAANRGVGIADVLAAVSGAGILMLRRSLVTAAPGKVPVAIGVRGAERRVAGSAILNRHAANTTGADRGKGDNQNDNHASHANLTTLTLAYRAGQG